MKYKLRHILSVLLLAIFVGNSAYTAVFTHTHIVENVFIKHAHPFSSSHNHTSAEYRLLNSVYTGTYLQSDVCSVPDVYVKLVYTTEIECPDFHYARLSKHTSLRAPPIV